MRVEIIILKANVSEIKRFSIYSKILCKVLQKVQVQNFNKVSFVLNRDQKQGQVLWTLSLLSLMGLVWATLHISSWIENLPLGYISSGTCT